MGEREDGLCSCQEKRVASASREIVCLRAGLAAIRLETQRQFAVNLRGAKIGWGRARRLLLPEGDPIHSDKNEGTKHAEAIDRESAVSLRSFHRNLFSGPKDTGLSTDAPQLLAGARGAFRKEKAQAPMMKFECARMLPLSA